MNRVSMPFRAEFIPHIVGTEMPLKTVTRRFTPRHVGTLLRAKVPKPGKRPGQWPGFANLIVVSCSSERLQDIARPSCPEHGDVGCGGRRAADEINREGFVTLDEFIRVWEDIYEDQDGLGWGDNPPVWRIEFRRQEAKR